MKHLLTDPFRRWQIIANYSSSLAWSKSVKSLRRCICPNLPNHHSDTTLFIFMKDVCRQTDISLWLDKTWRRNIGCVVCDDVYGSVHGDRPRGMCSYRSMVVVIINYWAVVGSEILRLLLGKNVVFSKYYPHYKWPFLCDTHSLIRLK